MPVLAPVPVLLPLGLPLLLIIIIVKGLLFTIAILIVVETPLPDFPSPSNTLSGKTDIVYRGVACLVATDDSVEPIRTIHTRFSRGNCSFCQPPVEAQRCYSCTQKTALLRDHRWVGAHVALATARGRS
jgi:hypothetical protein